MYDTYGMSVCADYVPEYERESTGLLDFRLRHAHYASFRSSSFECDDYLINRIWDMCLHTHEMCLEDTFTDCPTYEQSFWIGDAQMTALINGYVFGDYELIRHNLMMAVTGTENTKLMNALTPTDWTTSIPMWMMNWVISVSQYLELTKDESIVKDLYPYMSETLKYYENFIQEDGGFLINAWNMVDWAAMDIHNHGVVAGQQAELSWCYQLAAEFAKTQGEMEDYERFLACRKN